MDKRNNFAASNSIFIGSCLFLVGSAIFTVEAIQETIALPSIGNFFYLVACLLFTIGSLLFLYSLKAQ